MAWATTVDATQLVSITNTEQFFDTLVTLGPREIADCQVDVDFVVTPTDDMVVAVYTTVKESPDKWDKVPFFGLVVDKGNDPNILSFLVGPGVYKFRVGVAASGAVDTHTSADLSYKLDGVSA